MAVTTKLTYAEAKLILDNDKYSQFKEQSSKIHIVLSPKYLGRLQSGIADHLNLKLKLYNEIWGGSPIAYNNVKLLQRNSRIIEEQPYLHFDIQADFIVFSPKIGCTLKGIVNKTSKFHVGCLVHDCFNASIPKPKKSVGGWMGSSFTVGTEFLFVVTGIFTNNNVLSMKGYIKDDWVLSNKTKKRKHEEIHSLQDEGFHSESPYREMKESSKKKTRKHYISDNSLVPSSTESLGTQPSSTDQVEEESVIKKKKKKSKDSVDRFEESQFHIRTTDEETLCPQRKMKKHKHKHRKYLQNQSDISINQSEDGNCVINQSETSIISESHLSGRVIDSPDETFLEKKLKKKKKKKNRDPDTSVVDISMNTPSNDHCDFENSLHKKSTNMIYDSYVT
ncbi:hypothetical protein CHS0354_009222 [Potamilus streckersoni]|uniref:DNA-directed RNA polymerase I subunit RPA43 n=1 Tax=Potamilus streckersoni TaxID=2493646 RepID=A0AAE0T063_9BIVA|nr:hypothetical protein CHS0354_009222 [Potamilus streckersoni]